MTHSLIRTRLDDHALTQGSAIQWGPTSSIRATALAQQFDMDDPCMPGGDCMLFVACWAYCIMSGIQPDLHTVRQEHMLNIRSQILLSVLDADKKARALHGTAPADHVDWMPLPTQPTEPASVGPVQHPGPAPSRPLGPQPGSTGWRQDPPTKRQTLLPSWQTPTDRNPQPASFQCKRPCPHDPDPPSSKGPRIVNKKSLKRKGVRIDLTTGDVGTDEQPPKLYYNKSNKDQDEIQGNHPYG